MATLNQYRKRGLTALLSVLHRKWVVLRLQIGRLAGIGRTTQAVHNLFGFLALVLSGVYSLACRGFDWVWRVLRRAACYIDPLAELLAAAGAELRLAGLRLRSRSAPRDRLIPCMLLLTATVCICTTSFLGIELKVSINGQTMGYVSSRSEMEAILDRVSEQVSDYLGTPYSLDLDVAYSLGYSTGGQAVNEESVSNFILSSLGNQTARYVLTVDGQVVGAHDSRTALELLRQRMLESNAVSTHGGRVEFVQDVAVTPASGTDVTLMSIDEIESRLSGNTSESVVYTVQAGDTVSAIAQKYDTTVSAILSINPGLQAEKIHVGDEITLAASVPTLSVKETVTEHYTRRVGYETVKETTDALYTTQSRVKQAGVYGEAEVTADVVYVDGQEQSRTILEWINTVEPVDEIIEVGTKQPPKKAATGSFMKPSNGYFSSGYGYRRSLGDFHTGVDFAGSVGTSIFASDGGKVTYAGWKGNYGYCVFIDHGNGFTTVYAHCSRLLVKVGQSVAKGETIALVGSTGRSTGPHVHFEIRLNGKTVNPLNYISK